MNNRLHFGLGLIGILVLTPSGSHADSLGPFGCTQETCCMPSDPDPDHFGDTHYIGLWNCSQDWINFLWNVYDMETGEWDEGFGYGDVCNADKPLARTFNAMWAACMSSPNPPTHTGDFSGSILRWAGNYSIMHNDEPQADCGSGYATAYWPPFDDYVELHHAFFYELTVPERVGTLVHEARHIELSCDHNGESCPRGTSCDESWDYGCFYGQMGPVPGTNTFQITWLWEFYKDGQYTTTPMKHRALAAANLKLARAYDSDPCFRIGLDGNAYQLPITECVENVVLGNASQVKPVNHPAGHCLSEYSNGVLDFNYWCGAPWNMGQDFRLIAANHAAHPSAVRIQNTDTGLCWRVNASTSYVAMPTGQVCLRYPWNSQITAGSCSGTESIFFVVPFTNENTSPGLTGHSPDSSWRIRPLVTCFDADWDPVLDADSCVDADSLGDDVLRVFWCHNNDRQKLKATQWYMSN